MDAICKCEWTGTYNSENGVIKTAFACVKHAPSWEIIAIFMAEDYGKASNLARESIKLTYGEFPNWNEFNIEPFFPNVAVGLLQMNYNEELPEYGDLMTVKEFIEACKYNSFIDYDGIGCPVKDGKMSDKLIYPSRYKEDLPKDATHIMWFNR